MSNDNYNTANQITESGLASIIYTLRKLQLPDEEIMDMVTGNLDGLIGDEDEELKRVGADFIELVEDVERNIFVKKGVQEFYQKADEYAKSIA